MTDRKTDEDLLAMARAADRKVHVGSTFNHVRTRKLYVVIGVALRSDDLEPLVVYRRPDSPEPLSFARPLEEFLERFEFNTRPTVAR